MTEHFKAFKKVDEIFELFFEKTNGDSAIWSPGSAIQSHRSQYIAAMTNLDYLARDGNNYMLGNRILQLSGLMRRNMEFRRSPFPSGG